MSVEITVFGKPSCPQCTTVKRHLDRLGVAYTYRDVTEDETARAEVDRLGYLGVPVTVAGEMHRQGYRPDWLNQVALARVVTPDTAECEADAEAEMTDPDEEPCTRCGFHTSGLLDDDGVCPDCICAEDGAA